MTDNNSENYTTTCYDPIAEANSRLLGCIKEKQISSAVENMLRRHWCPDAVTIKNPQISPFKEVPSAMLLPGELSAVTFRVGCYIVRSARRVYNVYEPGYIPEKETPASPEDVELVRQENRDFLRIGSPSWSERLRITHEISARHLADPDEKFVYICRAAEARNYSWFETMDSIWIAKRRKIESRKKACLFVKMIFENRSFTVSYWYMMEPDGSISTLVRHPYDSNAEEARFTKRTDSIEIMQS